MNAPSVSESGNWKRRLARALDLFYPAWCAVCSVKLSHGRALCPECAASLPSLTDPFCLTCGEAFPGNIDQSFECPNCTGVRFSFEFARPAMVRDDRTLDLIHHFKYHRHIHLAETLAVLANRAFDDPRLARARAEGWPLVPVPLHRSRLMHRHFNQAEEIARGLARRTGMPVLHALTRCRATDTQTRFGRRERMDNLRGAFQATRHAVRWLDAGPRAAVLVDDVLTTGSTVNECAKTLRKTGFLRVQVVTVMRG